MKITDLTSESVAGPEKCWPGHRKVGTKPGTGKNAGKRVNDCEKIKEQGVAEDDAGDVEQRFAVKMEKEKQRLAKLKQTDPEAYKREMEKRKTPSRIPPVSTFEGQGVAEGSLNEFAPDGFNGGDDDEGFSPEIAKMAQDDGFTKGAGLADGATLERAMAINHWHSTHGGMYKQYFAKGFKAGRMDKIRHNNKQYNLNLKLMKDGSIRHGEQGVAEGSDNTVSFEVDSENAYNRIMKKFGSVVDWHGDAMVVPHKYWGAVQELAYLAGGEATEVGNEHVDEASLATMRDYFAGDDEARDPYEITKQRVHFSKDKNSKAPVQKKFNSKAEYEDWLEQQKNKKAFKVTEGIIIGPSETGDPMDPQVAVLGGAGSYSLKGLYNKAQRESAQLTKDIGLGNFRSSAYNVKQLENTLNTIVAAHNELEAVRKGGGAKSRGIERGVDTKE